MIEQMTGDKQCAKCGDVKPMTGFHGRAVSKDGRHSYCKVCRLAMAKLKTDECVRSDYTPKRRPRESPTAWLLPSDPRSFIQRLASVTQHKHRHAYTVEPVVNLCFNIWSAAK